jgi:hypothetical protein
MSCAPSSRFAVPARWMAAAALILCGCGGIGIQSEALGGGSNTPAVDIAADGGVDEGSTAAPRNESGIDAGGGGSPDAGLRPQTYESSPLCKQIAGDCNPDIPACLYDYTADGGTCFTGALCKEPKGDSGPPVDFTACRVGNSGMGPMCGTAPPAPSNYNSQSTDGSACTQSSDCNIGYECVVGGGMGGSAGVCKHYCCNASTCTGSYDGNTEFCDIEPALGGELVPVCTSGPSCIPLADTNKCAEGMTCTIVNSETGQTACVTTGKSEAGEDCTTSKCDANLACIGGTCLELCNSDDQCPMGQTCTPPSAFYKSKIDVGLGLCEP